MYLSMVGAMRNKSSKMHFWINKGIRPILEAIGSYAKKETKLTFLSCVAERKGASLGDAFMSPSDACGSEFCYIFNFVSFVRHGFKG